MEEVSMLMNTNFKQLYLVDNIKAEIIVYCFNSYDKCNNMFRVVSMRFKKEVKIVKHMGKGDT